MPRKNSRLRMTVKINYIDKYQKVDLTKHVVERARFRRDDLKGLSENKVRSKIIHEINHSKLVGIHNKEEHRTFNGYIYVIKREKYKLVAVTMLLSEKRREMGKLNNKCIA